MSSPVPPPAPAPDASRPRASAPSAGHTRAIRSFAQREDAERAQAALADCNIESTIREFRVPDHVTGKLATRGCSLYIAPADSVAAARLLLKMPPSEAPAAATAKPEGPTRLRRSAGRRERQRSSLFMIGFALFCAAAMIVFATSGVFGPKKPKRPVDTSNIVVKEDLNGDTLPDVLREFTWEWTPLYHTEDRNFDAMWDHNWTWQKGKPAHRSIDLNYDGKYDEFTTYDPEGQPFFIDTKPGGSGPPLTRKIFRDGILWKTLEDRDADTHFDRVVEYDDIAAVVRDEALPKGSPENNHPIWPPPPAPERDDTTAIPATTKTPPAP